MNVTSSTPGRNVLSFKLSGSEKMRIASDGSVGIGTAAPATTLDVSGTTTLKGTTNLSNNNIISIGNAGIGTAAPAYKLDVIGSGSDSIVCRLQSGGANTATTYVNTGASNLDVGTGSGGHFIYGYGSYPLYFGVNGSEKMRITESGNVGIGTSTPNAPLQLAKTIVNRKIVLWEDWNNEHQYYGFGVNSAVLRYQTSGGDHVFYNGTSSTSSTELMRITSSGRVGIGTNTPRYALDVNGFAYADKVFIGGPDTGFSGPHAAPLLVTGYGGGTSYIHDHGTLSSSTGYDSTDALYASILTGYDILTFGTVRAVSDIRIKKNITPVDTALDLLRKLTPVTYNYIDYMRKTPNTEYGFIAQDTINVIKESVKKTNGNIPNLYFKGCLSVSEEKDSSYFCLTTTPENQFLFQNQSENKPVLIMLYDEKDREIVVEVIEQHDLQTVRVKKRTGPTDIGYGPVFVYGEQVDDFHVLDKDPIFTVTTAALQEVDRQQQADKARIAELETEIVSLKQELDKQKTLINSILERLAI